MHFGNAAIPLPPGLYPTLGGPPRFAVVTATTSITAKQRPTRGRGDGTPANSRDDALSEDGAYTDRAERAELVDLGQLPQELYYSSSPTPGQRLTPQQQQNRRDKEPPAAWQNGELLPGAAAGMPSLAHMAPGEQEKYITHLLRMAARPTGPAAPPLQPKASNERCTTPVEPQQTPDGPARVRRGSLNTSLESRSDLATPAKRTTPQGKARHGTPHLEPPLVAIDLSNPALPDSSQWQHGHIEGCSPAGPTAPFVGSPVSPFRPFVPATAWPFPAGPADGGLAHAVQQLQSQLAQQPPPPPAVPFAPPRQPATQLAATPPAHFNSSAQPLYHPPQSNPFVGPQLYAPPPPFLPQYTPPLKSSTPPLNSSHWTPFLETSFGNPFTWQTFDPLESSVIEEDTHFYLSSILTHMLCTLSLMGKDPSSLLHTVLPKMEEPLAPDAQDKKLRQLARLCADELQRVKLSFLRAGEEVAQLQNEIAYMQGKAKAIAVGASGPTPSQAPRNHSKEHMNTHNAVLNTDTQLERSNQSERRTGERTADDKKSPKRQQNANAQTSPHREVDYDSQISALSREVDLLRKDRRRQGEDLQSLRDDLRSSREREEGMRKLIEGARNARQGQYNQLDSRHTPEPHTVLHSFPPNINRAEGQSATGRGDFAPPIPARGETAPVANRGEHDASSRPVVHTPPPSGDARRNTPELRSDLQSLQAKIDQTQRSLDDGTFAFGGKTQLTEQTVRLLDEKSRLESELEKLQEKMRGVHSKQLQHKAQKRGQSSAVTAEAPGNGFVPLAHMPAFPGSKEQPASPTDISPLSSPPMPHLQPATNHNRPVGERDPATRGGDAVRAVSPSAQAAPRLRASSVPSQGGLFRADLDRRPLDKDVDGAPVLNARTRKEIEDERTARSEAASTVFYIDAQQPAGLTSREARQASQRKGRRRFHDAHNVPSEENPFNAPDLRRTALENHTEYRVEFTPVMFAPPGADPETMSIAYTHSERYADRYDKQDAHSVISHPHSHSQFGTSAFAAVQRGSMGQRGPRGPTSPQPRRRATVPQQSRPPSGRESAFTPTRVARAPSPGQSSFSYGFWAPP